MMIWERCRSMQAPSVRKGVACKRDIMEQQIERMHGDEQAVDPDEGTLRLLADCHDGIIGK